MVGSGVWIKSISKSGRFWVRLAVLISMLGASACSKSGHFSQSTNRSTIPAEYSASLDLLDYLRSVVTGSYPVPYGVDDKHWDADKVLSYISKDGLALYDVNTGVTNKYGLKELKSQLTRKKGKAYDSIVHAGHIYSQPYPQYSELSYQIVPKGIVVDMAEWYRLTFVLEGKEVRLLKLEYLTQEGD